MTEKNPFVPDSPAPSREDGQNQMLGCLSAILLRIGPQIFTHDELITATDPSMQINLGHDPESHTFKVWLRGPKVTTDHLYGGINPELRNLQNLMMLIAVMLSHMPDKKISIPLTEIKMIEGNHTVEQYLRPDGGFDLELKTVATLDESAEPRSVN